MPTESLPELAADDLATVTGAGGLRNGLYAGFVAASFLVGQPAGPLLDARAPMAPMSQTVGGR